MTARSRDTEAEIEAEDAAKEDLRHRSRWFPHTTSHETDAHPLEDDTEERQLLPLWLKGAANDAAASGGTEGAADSSSAALSLLDELQKMAFPAEQVHATPCVYNVPQVHFLPSSCPFGVTWNWGLMVQVEAQPSLLIS